jgi:hypothetical protein
MKAVSTMKLEGLIAVLALLGLPTLATAMSPASDHDLSRVIGMFTEHTCADNGPCATAPATCIV